MKKHTSNYHLGRDTHARKALFKGLIRSLILNEKITTTATKVAATKPIFEKLLTKAKQGGVAKIREIHAVLGDNTIVHKLVHEIAPRYQNIAGGYTKTLRYGTRRGDNATVVVWSLTQKKEVKPKKLDQAKPEVSETKTSKAKVKPTSKAKTPVAVKETKAKAVKLAPSRAGKRGDK